MIRAVLLIATGIFVTVWAAGHNKATDDGPDIVPTWAPYKTDALFVRHEAGEMIMDVTRVPEEPNQYPAICFEVVGKVAMECMYVSREDQSVSIISVTPEKSKL